MGVTDLVSKLRAFAADIANLCHSNDSRIFNSEEAKSFQSVVVKGKFYRKLAGMANPPAVIALRLIHLD